MKEEILQQAFELKKASEEAEKQLEFVNHQIKELEEFGNGIEEFGDIENKEILAPIGRGVFIKADRKDEKLFVEVGAGVVIKKDSGEVKEIIDGQIKKFHGARGQLREQLQEYASAFYEMLEEVKSIKK